MIIINFLEAASKLVRIPCRPFAGRCGKRLAMRYNKAPFGNLAVYPGVKGMT